MAWLSDWGKRIKYTIDHTKIDSDLTDFPVFVKVKEDDFYNDYGFDNFSEHFNVASGTENPDSNKWNRTLLYGTDQEFHVGDNNRMYYYSSGAANLGAYLQSRFFLFGDFEIILDWSYITFTQPSSSTSYMPLFYLFFADGGNVYMYRYRSSTGGNGYALNSSLSGESGNVFATTDTYGKIRIKRVGSNLTTWVWTNGRWEWNGNTAGHSWTYTNSTYAYTRIQINQDFDSTIEGHINNIHIINGGNGEIRYNVPWRKVAFTESDGVTQLYSEYENMNTVYNTGYYWVKLPTVYSGTDTEFYMYYDITKDDNTHYVNNTGTLDYSLAIDINTEGTYDTNHTGSPHVIKESDTSYKMFYSGNGTGGMWRNMYAISSDGATWSGHQLIMDVGGEGTYDTNGAYWPSVIKESASSYKMWYSGMDGSSVWRMCYATSTNGTTWTNHQLVVPTSSEGTYDTNGTGFGCVIKESASSYKMWYSGYDGTNWRIIYATSTNGTSWSNHQMVVDISEDGTYDSNSSYVPHVLKDGDLYRMFYGVYSTEGPKYRPMYAESVDGINWTKHQLLFNLGAEGTYDTSNILGPYVIKDNDVYKLWYYGNDGSNWRVLYAPIWSNNVWDYGYRGVWHCHSTLPGGSGAIKDSTPAAHNGTSAGSMAHEGDFVFNGTPGTGYYFDGIDDAINLSGALGLRGMSELTLELIFNAITKEGPWRKPVDYSGTSGANLNRHYRIFFNNDTGNESLIFYIADTSNVTIATTGIPSFPEGKPVYVAGTYDGTSNSDALKLYLQGTLETVSSSSTGSDVSNSTSGALYLGRDAYSTSQHANMIVGELRVSKIARPVAFIKANYYNMFDELITHGKVEYIPTQYYYGYTYELSVPVNREVRLYDRNTGELMDKTTSSGSEGYYYLTTSVSGEHYIVALDDDEGETYNALINDRMSPRGVI